MCCSALGIQNANNFFEESYGTHFADLESSGTTGRGFSASYERLESGQNSQTGDQRVNRSMMIARLAISVALELCRNCIKAPPSGTTLDIIIEF